VVLDKRGFRVYYVAVDWGLNFLSVTIPTQSSGGALTAGGDCFMAEAVTPK